MSREVATELVGGPWDGRTGRLTVIDQPASRLMFNLDDADARSGLIIPGVQSPSSELFAFYDLIDEKPRKVVLIEDVDGHPRARSERGVRYRYSKDSPCQRLFAEADADAALTSAAHDAVAATRRLLLTDSKPTKGSTVTHLLRNGAMLHALPDAFADETTHDESRVTCPVCIDHIERDRT